MTTTDPNSDYNTASTDLFQQLPEPLQSDTNRAVMSNLFNRFLSKTETEHVVGYIGRGNPAAIVSRQIKEPTVHRQAFQLQPMLYEKIGSVEHINSWYDILNGLSQQGIDVSRLAEWGRALEFNWAPPIDINKIVNYRDYYWYDPDNPQSQPQYITVKSECAYAMALVSFYQSLIAENGATFTIVGVIPSESSLVVQGNFLTLFSPGFVFYVVNSPNVDLNNSFQQVASSTYNATLDQTTIVITNAFSDASLGGEITLEQQLSIYEGIANCKCTGQVGWDVLPWDDNQPNTPPPIWNASLITDISYPTLGAWDAAHPVITPGEGYLWWDTTNDILYVLTDETAPGVLASWKAVYFNFSLIEQQTVGTGYWDLTSGCADTTTIAGLSQWINQNKWVHKADVPNFSIAKQAQAPIIEFEPNLELSEWTQTTYNWQYRPDTQTAFGPSEITPTRIELEPLNIYTNTTNTITFDERFGDLTNVFVPGYVFLIKGIASSFTVANSVFKRTSTPYGAFETVVTVVETLPGVLTPNVNYVHPQTTSAGDPFLNYGDQWLFDGIGTTTAVNHQFNNGMMTPSIPGPSYPQYTTALAPYAERFDIVGAGVTTLNFDVYVGPGSTRPLTERALVGNGDVRVYVNGVRQYGNYDELGTQYVTGVQFHAPLQILDTVLVQVGEATYSDFGNYAVPVRTIVDDFDYTNLGPQLVSLVEYRLSEQVKSATNQYPLFDIYTTDSQSARIANPLFGYYDAPEGVLYPYIGQRIVQADDGTLMFQNYLVETNNGRMYAYRNYNKSSDLYWYNSNTNQVLVWTGQTWSAKYDTYSVTGGSSSYITSVEVLEALPSTPPFDGYIVFNTTDKTLYGWNINTSTQSGWTLVSGGWYKHDVYIATSDQTLETTWRHGSNYEQYVPSRVDWQRRTYDKYLAEQETYVETVVPELMAADPSLTVTQAEALANQQWDTEQQRATVPEWYTDDSTPTPVTQGPIWIGNWEIPNTLYYNVDHENWQYLSQTQLLTHFTTIIDAQPSFPGFGGQASANWRLIDYTLINWGLGGTIKEYDNSFDTFLSSQTTNTVTPPALFEFAQNEYENIITMLRDIYLRNLAGYMTNNDPAAVIDTSQYAAKQVLNQYEQNEAANLVYGDSTTFTQGTLTTPSTGVRNWIATLPFFGIVPKYLPYVLDDDKHKIDEVVHHDGHRATLSISSSIINSLQHAIISMQDPRAPGEKYGRLKTTQPPSTQANFIAQFSPVLRNNVYWLVGPTLYRLVVAQVGTAPPSINVPDGSLWWDTTTGAPTLRQQVTVGSVVSWPPAPGFTVGDGRLYNGGSVETSSVSAWQVVDINEQFLQTILHAETLLWEQVPPPPLTPPIDFAAIRSKDPQLWNQYEQQQFKNYTIERQIALPYANTQYNPIDPFTWNYKYSDLMTPPRAGTIESGGCWQDVYEKAYGTPYPHLEPWILQGYVDKPSWWDAKYAVTTFEDKQTYNNRRWKYTHALEVTNAAPNIIFFTGDVRELFNGFDTFRVYYTDNVSSAVFTITSVSYGLGITTVHVSEPTGLVTTGALACVGMWDYILRGAIPAGEEPPLTTPPQYLYVSVNISNNTFVNGQNVTSPDDVLPPYWEVSGIVPAIDLSVRSMFDSTGDIHLENADYLWEDAGPVEWKWRQSTNYLYSQVTVAYQMEPVRVIQSIFGTKYEYIDSLPIDNLTGQVFSHSNTQFHGEITVDGQVVRVNGINQWYVNFNRAAGFDTSYSDFRAMWTAWTAPLSYQFGSFIDTSSLSVDHRVVDLTTQDYSITMKRSPGVLNYWIDSFKVRVTNVPPNYGSYDTQSEWAFEIEAEAPVARTISYYGVKLYDYYVDPATSICHLYTYPVANVSLIQNSFIIDGDVSQTLGGVNGAAQLKASGSNAGIYTIISSTYDPVAKQTTVVVKQPILSGATSTLVSAVNYRTLPWKSGDLVSVATTGLLPLPLNESQQFFIIRLSDTTFQFAYSAQDVIANLPILFTTQAIGIQRVGQLYNTFLALGGQNASTIWSHYDVDTSVVNQLTLPAQISGVQNLINIIDGYSKYLTDEGFGINLSGAYTDPATGKPVSWQNEIERFIDWAFQQRSVRRTRMNDKYPVDVDYTTGKFMFTSQNPGFLTGSQVVVWSFGGGLPPPLLIGQQYYIINNADGTVSLASNMTNARAGIAVTINYIGGVGDLYISSAELYAAELPTYEINPFRNALWFSPEFGIMSNVIQGPYEDVYSTQLIFDQYGRRLSPADIRVFRQDKITQIQYAGGVYNDVDVLQNYQYNPYQYLHIGGANLYVDTYEHLLKFNDETTKGALIYESFLGLNVTKWELDFYKSTQFTQRPNVGGYFLSQPYNQGANEERNIEGSVEDLRYMYDPYAIPETLPSVARTRSLLGYKGSSDYLSQINLTAKSQFLFWKGAIHNKGSLNCISAFVNSRRFINAKVDEFWAYKIADFGPVETPEYLSMLLTTEDTQTNELRLEFILADQVCLPGYAQETFGNTDCGYAYPPDFATVANGVDDSFTAISMTNEDRWYQQPNQLAQLVPDGGVLYFNLNPKKKLVVYPVELVSAFNPQDPSTFAQIGQILTTEVGIIAYDPGSFLQTSIPDQVHAYTSWVFNGTTFDYAGGWDAPSLPIFRHNFMADVVTLTMQWWPDSTRDIHVIPNTPAVVTQLDLTIPYLPLTNSLSVFKGTTVDSQGNLIDGVLLQPGIDYVESLEPYMGSNVLAYKLYFADTISGSTIEVVYGPSQLSEDTQFQIVNTNVFGLLSQELVDQLFVRNVPLTVWGLTVDKEAQNPAKIIDKQSNTVLSPVTYWDPARGYHYYEALNALDLLTDGDPADYDNLSGWKSQKVGTTWMDTTNVQYMPYYDTHVITDLDARLASWGQLTDFGQVKIYQWTESSVPPSEYNEVARKQEGDNTIPSEIRYSGTVREVVEYRDRLHTTAVVTPATRGTAQVVIGTGPIVTTDPTGFRRPIQEFDTLFGGVGYVDGIYYNVPLTGSSTGSGAEASITVDGGSVVSVVLQVAGDDYRVGDVLTASNTYLGGTGSGFTISVATIQDVSFTITLDGTFTRTVVFPVEEMLTYGDLVTVLSEQFAVYNATIAIDNTLPGLLITSNTLGSSSSVVISADDFFVNLTDYVSIAPGLPAEDQVITVADITGFAVGSTVLFSSTGTLPSGLDLSTVYTISSVSGNDIQIAGATLTNAGTGVITMSSSVWPSQWTPDVQTQVNLDASIDAVETSPGVYTFAQATTQLDGETVDVYVNGILVQSNYTISGNMVFPSSGSGYVLPSLSNVDRVTLLVPIYTPTDQDLAFDPDNVDNGTVQTQWRLTTPYVATQYIDTTTNQVQTKYYFWVQNKTTPSAPGRESISEAVRDVIAPPAPYMFYNKLLYPALTVNVETEETIEMPFRFSQAIVRGLRGYVNVDNRYVLRFTRDFTLRDNLAFGTSPLQLKDAHQEWLMFREQQLTNVPLDLWNKITEAMAGYLLNDPSSRVPSLSRQLYDESHGTSTQYGLGTGQAFVNGQTAIATVQAYLTDPKNNFYPVDMDDFFDTYNFDTPANCIEIMNQIYNTFSYIHVNAIFFSVLMDALSVQKEYAGLMKTSAIALYGIELLDVAGAFDD